MNAVKDWFLALSLVNRAIVLGLSLIVLFLVGSSFSNQNADYQFKLDQALPEVSTQPLGQIYVHVAGEVVNPGLYQLEAGARVQEAIDLAGGMTVDAFEQSINLARMVSDGEQIVVLALGQIASGASTGFVSLNNATQEQLETLPGVGPAIAKAIIEYRNQVGSFSDVTQLREVAGIGSKLFAKISPQLSL